MKRHTLTPWKVRAALVAFTIAAGVPWAGCGSANSSPPPASSGDAGQANTQVATSKPKAAAKGRGAKVKSETRREHMKEVRAKRPETSP